MHIRCKNCGKLYGVQRDKITSGGDCSTYFTNCPYCNFGAKLSYDEVVREFGKITVATPPQHGIECVCSYCKDHFFATPEEVSKKGMTYFANCKKCGFCNALPVKETEEILKSIKVNTNSIPQQIFKEFGKQPLVVSIDYEGNIIVSPNEGQKEATFLAYFFKVLTILNTKVCLKQVSNAIHTSIFSVRRTEKDPITCTITCKYNW